MRTATVQRSHLRWTGQTGKSVFAHGHYWIQREGAEDVIVPNVTRFGEKNKTTEEQGWEDVPPGTALEGLLLPQPPGKAYRLLKIVTQPATPDQLARPGNDRAPVIRR